MQDRLTLRQEGGCDGHGDRKEGAMVAVTRAVAGQRDLEILQQQN